MKTAIFSLLSILLFLSCSGGSPKNAADSQADTQAPPVIYTAGYAYSGSLRVPALWKNNEPQPISRVSNASGEAKSVFVSNGNVYASGYEATGGTQYAALWINGSLYHLCTGGDANAGNSVFVQGGDTYVAVRMGGRAALWKNSSASTISSSVSDARGIYVSGSDVYIVGYIRNSQGRNVATIWKNGAAQQLPEVLGYQQTSSEANSVYVSGSDVYVAG